MRAKARARVKRLADSYFELVKRFPLRKLRNDAEHVAAMKFSDPLMRRATVDDLDEGESDYLYALGFIIQEYERGRFLLDGEAPTVAEKIRFLMEQRGMTSGDLGKVLGYPSGASEILNGTREPSKAQIRKLAEHFKVSPAVFL